jgi:two-component system, sensor histidine kinase PdtaS
MSTELSAFASPNGLSAFNRLGIAGELEGKSLAEAATKIVKKQSTVDESLPLVLTGKAPWRADLESTNLTLSIRAIPLLKAGARTGAIVLCREITELRRQEQELLTKDAIIREIHHRVKNNLQTVASVMRIQTRRSDNPEVKDALEQAIRRVSAIALVHNTLAEGFTEEVNFDEVFADSMRLVGELSFGKLQDTKASNRWKVWKAKQRSGYPAGSCANRAGHKRCNSWTRFPRWTNLTKRQENCQAAHD